jgi:hypothetical protein
LLSAILSVGSGYFPPILQKCSFLFPVPLPLSIIAVFPLFSLVLLTVSHSGFPTFFFLVHFSIIFSWPQQRQQQQKHPANLSVGEAKANPPPPPPKAAKGILSTSTTWEGE